ncbi:MAG: DUF4157 domain-containing protein, partial [Verrucomicrobiales bacterium]|nr:DUF4157 domain-containing protein [Verrucomicrobiales bacterium]
MLAPPVQRASPGSTHSDDLESSASPKTPEPESIAPPLLQRACASCEHEKQAPRWQAKYAVHPPGDRWEQEADRAARAVTRGSPAPRLTEVSSGGLASGIQRRNRPAPTPAPRARHPAVRPDPVARVLGQPAPGAPLHPPSRRQIESTLGADLAHVRVHTGPAAEEATESIQARAFTHGRDIWIGRGESPTDPELLAHEAAHVVQQHAAPTTPTPPPAPTRPPAPTAPLQTT